MASEDENKRAEAGEEHTQGVPTGTQIIGTYAITEMIAAGGMGEVYRGENIHTNQSVAIKIVLAELAEDGPLSSKPSCWSHGLQPHLVLVGEPRTAAASCRAVGPAGTGRSTP